MQQTALMPTPYSDLVTGQYAPLYLGLPGQVMYEEAYFKST
jgi:hypothetical protein